MQANGYTIGSSKLTKRANEPDAADAVIQGSSNNASSSLKNQDLPLSRRSDSKSKEIGTADKFDSKVSSRMSSAKHATDFKKDNNGIIS